MGKLGNQRKLDIIDNIIKQSKDYKELTEHWDRLNSIVIEDIQKLLDLHKEAIDKYIELGIIKVADDFDIRLESFKSVMENHSEVDAYGAILGSYKYTHIRIKDMKIPVGFLGLNRYTYGDIRKAISGQPGETIKEVQVILEQLDKEVYSFVKRKIELRKKILDLYNFFFSDDFNLTKEFIETNYKNLLR